MAFTEDLSVFFDTADHAVAATWVKGSGGGGTVNGILDADYQEIGDVGASVPTFTCAAADVPGVREGDRLTIAGVDYRVWGPPQPDGTGLVVLLTLHKF